MEFKQREFRFRFWNASTKSFEKEWAISGSNKLLFVYLSPGNLALSYSAFQHAKQAPHIVITQYTGLKDCNNKEIYEGDIIKVPVSNALGVVGFSVRGYFGYSSKLTASLFPFSDLILEEIVGNIFENPELLCKVN